MINEDIDTDDYVEPLTTVIGIKSKDGIVLAADSQATMDLAKHLQADKILQVNKLSALAGAGKGEHVKKLWRVLQKRISNRSFNDDQLIDNTQSILDDLYKKYNVQESKNMGLSQTEIKFCALSILDTKLRDRTLGLYILDTDGFVSPVDKYATIGSGRALGRFILDLHSRTPGYRFSDLSVNVNWFAACVALNIVGNYDSQSGGNTRIVTITKYGFEMAFDPEYGQSLTNLFLSVELEQLPKPVEYAAGLPRGQNARTRLNH